ncbi:MAG: S8 family serine peptidase [Candidatus Thorarchaeota archaeon]
MQKAKILTLYLLAIFTLPILFGSYVSNAPVAAVPLERNTFNPIVGADLVADSNRNKIHDHLDTMMITGFTSTIYETIVTFDQPVTDEIVGKIEAVGGTVLSSWSVIYGACVRIRADKINALSSLGEVTFVTENFRSRQLLSTSVPQINVRPYVWDTLGYEGNPNHAIAILDSGVDDSHPDLTGRISHWEDFIGADASAGGDEYGTAIDPNGHGTHCASIASGTGAAAGTDSTVKVTGTLGIPSALPELNGYVSYVEVESTGYVSIKIDWEDIPGPSSATDTIMIVIDTDSSNSFTGADEMFTGDYSAAPLTFTTTNQLSAGKYAVLIGGYDDYEIGRGVITYTFTRPASSPSDGYNKYRGVAPGCDIVGLKVLDDEGYGSSTILLDALNWVSTNGLTYDIQILSMSLGLDGQSVAVDTAINNLVSLGYICVVAAGNAFMDGDPIYSPGTAEKAITVGAIDDVDKIAIYSSNGGSGSGKPDVVAPGGAYQYMETTDEDTHPIVAADSNDYDCIEITSGTTGTYWETDLTANDYAAYQGTSMATPHVAGLCALIIDAMGSDWTHTEADVLKVKNYLCGTATEVGAGEWYDTYHNAPSLDRGDADLVEGFGKVHGDAAIESFLSTYTTGSIVTESLGANPYSKQSWARKVELEAGIIFTAGIEIDGTADYDLYLYDPSQDMSTHLGYLEKSTTAGTGVPENIAYTPSSDMTAYLVVKRVSGYGSFTLSAEATATGSSPGFTFPFAVPIVAWAIMGAVGLASIVFILKKRA